ncbi:MAG: bifunctional (p)ppGpp synthetase/guanosine-3',5'-bis(diphosphate) 3'-pyrophosphohydrolase [Hyphomicrobiales bacterium]|nr:MAG: bifunctional (p)ppGpp synthetase/guanosine-3',5'-bis(diphosphate) 3'-pyrophosphohydrolase [Hyphomicrobiales bacterium]
MMRQFELVERVKSYDQSADEALLNRAYIYAMKAHGTQKRASGDPYFSHPLEVAAILANMKLDDATIVTALLHDTIEDTDSTREELDELFGEEIGTLVEGVTKIEQLNLASRKAAQAENLRKLLIAISSDVRVLLVKMADRLHNMRTLHYVRPEKRVRIAEETMDIYAPLAARMGMQEIREELEDLSFKALNPEARDAILAHLEETKDSRAAIIPGIVELLQNKLKEHGIDAEIKWREKRPFSIWRKMERRSISLEQLSDILGFRIIVNTVDACYLALGVVHQNWPMVPERFKDHISLPKENDYRTIHTTVIDSKGHRIELQIRTWEMNEVAERGIAAHALYKDQGDGAVPLSRDSNAYRWLRGMVDRLNEGATPEEFLEHTKLELFQDQVFCFTPKGRLIVLPQRATPIDFAYAVHTDVGNKCVGSKINGRHAPLTTRLRNGDEVEIFCSEAQVPPAAWEKIAITAKARSAIKRANREAMRAQYVSLGEEILKRAFKREGLTYREEALIGVLPKLARAEASDVTEAIGRGELSSETVIAAVAPEGGSGAERPEQKKRFGRRAEGKGWFGLGKAMGVKFNLLDAARKKDSPAGTVLPVRGLGHSNMPVRFATRCSALPGERIVGIMIPGEGVVIYPIDSRQLEQYSRDTDNWIDVAWDLDEDNPERFPAALRVTVMNEPGTLGQITQAIGANDGNIENIDITDRAPDFFKMNIELSVFDIKHLNKIIAVISRLQPVSSVRRLTCDDFPEGSKN